MEAISYIRFSSSEQKKGGSLSRQSEVIAAHITAMGWTAGKTILDDGRSGYHGEHRRADRGLGSFEIEASTGEHRNKVLVVERLDRLSREKPQTTWNLISKLHSCGVSIATVDGPRFYSAHTDLEMFSILEILMRSAGNNEESAKKSAHISREWEKRRERAKASGIMLTKQGPAWIKIGKDRKPVVIEDRAALILRWFEMADAGMGALGIANAMEREGIPVWSRFENREATVWQRTYISRVLRDRAVLGEFQPMIKKDGKRVPDGEPWLSHFPQIVSHDLFNRVNRLAHARKIAMGGRKSDQVSNLAAGLCRCAGCGATMRYHRGRVAGQSWTNPQGKKYTYKRTNGSLVCPTATTSRGAKCTNKAHWAYLSFEDGLLDQVLHLAMDDSVFADRSEVSRLNNTIAERERQLEVLTSKAKRLLSLWTEDGSDLARQQALEAEAEGRRLRGNIEALKIQREAASGRATSQEHIRRVADIRANLHADDDAVRVEVRRKVAVQLNTLISRIEFGESKVRVLLHGASGFFHLDRKGKFAGGLDTLRDDRAYPGLEDYRRRRAAALDEGEHFGAWQTIGRKREA